MKLYSFLFSLAAADVNFSDFVCVENCSPDKCSNVTNEPCDLADGVFDAPQLIADMECKVCE